MKIPDHIFREYDIRGNVGLELTEEFAYLLGRAYARLAKENNLNNIAIGHDCRLSSAPYARELARGINDEGLNATILGLGPTPVMYWSLFEYDFGGGIQVTGSHNPPEMNGFKICLGKQTIHGEKIQLLKQYVHEALEQIDQVSKNPGRSNTQSIIEKKET